MEGPLWFCVLQSYYNFSTVGYFLFNKILEFIFWVFWWFKMWIDMKNSIVFYSICARLKNPWHYPYGLLQPLSILKWPWSFIWMDFIINLPSLNSFDAICIIIDSLMEMVCFMPCKKMIFKEEIIRIFLDNVYKYYDLLDNIILNWRLQFLSKFKNSYLKY